MAKQKYIPALSAGWLTPLYDTLVEGPMSALRMRKDLLGLAGDLNGKKILDVGCGTGTLALMIKRANPEAEVAGLDGDPQILEIARRKAKEEGLEIRFEQGMSYSLPYPGESFDMVTTSLMLHHLGREDKQNTAVEMYRVLHHGGHMIGIDFAQTRNLIGAALHPFERVADNVDGFLPAMFQAAGFTDFAEARRYVFRTIALFQASKP